MGFFDFLKKAAGAVIPGADLGLSLLSGGLGALSGSKQANAQKQALEQENANRAAYEKWAQEFLAANAGALNAPSTSTSTSTGAMTGGGSESAKQRYVGWDPSTGTALDRSLLQRYMRNIDEDVIRQQELDKLRAAAATSGEQEIATAREAMGRMNIAPGSMRAATTVMPATATRNMNIAMQDVNARTTNEQASREALAAAEAMVKSRGGQNTSRNYTNWQNTTGTTSGTQFDPLRSLQFQAQLGAPQGKVSTNTGYNPWLSGAQDLTGALGMWYANKNKTPATSGTTTGDGWVFENGSWVKR